MKTVTSTDGTPIAYEVTGSGPPVILVGGAFNDRRGRASGTPLAALLAGFSVYSYDRRGRGDSGDTPPYAIASEISDLTVMIEAAGGSACVYGMSSGALLALATAETPVTITKLAMYEPPLRITDDATLAVLQQATDEGRRADCVEIFMTRAMGMPEQRVASMKQSPMWSGLEAIAHTLVYDLRITRESKKLVEAAARVKAETLVLAGAASPAWMREGAERLVSAIPTAQLQALEGQTHDVDINRLAPVLASFFASEPECGESGMIDRSRT